MPKLESQVREHRLCLVKGDASDNLEVFGGYDQNISWPIPEWWDDEQKTRAAPHFLSNEEMKELADFMSRRWRDLANRL